MLALIKQINWWRVAAYALLATAIGGFLTGLLLESNAILWGIGALTAYMNVRLEWTLMTAKDNSDDEYT